MKTTFGLLICLTAGLAISTTAAAQGQVTFAKDVAPIFQEHCQNCHHMGTVAPMSLAATMYHALGIDPDDEFTTPDGRPIKIVNQGRVIEELV